MLTCSHGRKKPKTQVRKIFALLVHQLFPFTLNQKQHKVSLFSTLICAGPVGVVDDVTGGLKLL
jgi:hypothetical protein